MIQNTENRISPNDWRIRPNLKFKTWAFVLIAILLLTFTGQRTEMDQAVVKTGQGLMHGVGVVDDSEVGRGFTQFWETAFPLVLEERIAVSRIENFDRNELPMFAYVVDQPIKEYDFETNTFKQVGVGEYLVQPFGYLALVAGKILETLEIALWGTLLAVLLALPSAYLSASNITRNWMLYSLGRGFCSWTRSIPDLILAMFMVLMFGFGPIAGILALAIHTSGFLGKFFADDMENCDRGPQEAMESTGASKLKVLRMAVIPQIFPQCFSYVQYILERNVRMATVLGIVGAGGIGMELKGRWDMSDFGHVSTILLAVFCVVICLEYFTQLVRKKLINKE